jgi:hypothetical protein
MLNELETNIKMYAELQEQKDSIEFQLSELKTKIIEAMTENGEVMTETSDGLVAKIIKRDTYKYVDETQMISYLKDNNLLQFLTEKINTTTMNKELKSKSVLSEELKNYYTHTIQDALTIKAKASD